MISKGIPEIAAQIYITVTKLRGGTPSFIMIKGKNANLAKAGCNAQKTVEIIHLACIEISLEYSIAITTEMVNPDNAQKS